jgi:outer membrane protein
MKKLFKVALVAVCMIFMGNFAKAQTKIGHIDFGAVYTSMPEFKTINTQLDAFKKQFIDQLTALNTELQTKSQAYQAGLSTMTPAVKTAKESELNDLNKRMQDYQTSAQQQVEAKGNELSKPLLDKVKAAVTAVAKEKGYGYVIDTSQTALLVAPDGDNLMAAVKLKLALK